MSRRRKRPHGNPRRPSGPPAPPRPSPGSRAGPRREDLRSLFGLGARRPDDGSTADLEEALLRAAVGHRADPGGSAQLVLDGFPPSLAADAAASIVERQLPRCWADGWQPVELVWQVRRNAGTAAADAVRPAIGRALAGIDRGALHPSWRDQLQELDVASEPSERWGAEVLDRHGLDPLIALVSAIALLPPVEVLLPVPGRPDIALAAASGFDDVGIDAKVLDRVRALLAKAEGTDFEAEAQAFTAKAHELMTRHNLEHALVTADPAASDRPGARRFCVDDPYADARMTLLSVIAGATRCSSVMSPRLHMVTVVGYGADLAAVDVLFTSLLVQAQTALDVLARSSQTGSRERSRGFRSSFLKGFAHRIGDRLEEAGRATVEDLDSHAGGALVPVLAARSEAVDDQVASMFPRLRTKRFAGPSDGLGWAAGRDAADRADLPFGRLRTG